MYGIVVNSVVRMDDLLNALEKEAIGAAKSGLDKSEWTDTRIERLLNTAQILEDSIKDMKPESDIEYNYDKE